MKRILFVACLMPTLWLAPAFVKAQQMQDPALQSITAAELRNHIFFLASDYLNGRQAVTPEYGIAANYVATQFAAAGLKPAVTVDGAESFMQGVPFAKTVFSDQVQWTVSVNGQETRLDLLKDFKVMMGNRLNFDRIPVVYVGYGIEDETAKWNDLRDLDLTGKMVVCLTGTPMKNGKPVLPKEINDKYAGDRGMYSKIFNGLNDKGIAGLILVDLDGSAGMTFEKARNAFSTEKTIYKGAKDDGGPSGGFPQLFFAKPEFLDAIMPGHPNNPRSESGNVMKNYKPQELKGVLFSSKNEILTENMIYSNNVVGMVPGTDPVLKNEYIVIGAHLDHVAPQQGKPSNGADDNASGSAGVIEIAGAIAQNPCKRSVIFITYTAEEMGLLGSSYFLESGLVPAEQIRFNINLDMIGRTGKGNESTRAHYVVTDKKYLAAITSFIKEINDGITDFPILYDDDEHSPGGSDHMTFIGKGIPAFFFFSGVHADLHRPGDDPEKIDYPKAESISRLSYLLTRKLGNMDVVPTFN